MRPRNFATRATLTILAVSVLSAVAASALPDNPYQRWQLLDQTIHNRASWIYERIHYDPTPIDVAIVGPSRIGSGINSVRIEAGLRARGTAAHVVNFSLPETGRNINYTIVHELLSKKTPKLLVLGVIEKPGRYGHSAFKYIAPPQQVVAPGYLGLNYPSDLIYLPFRQLKLFGARLFPGMAQIPASFDPARYRGANIDTTGDVTMPNGTVKQGTRPAPMAELMRGVHKLEKGNTPPVLPPSMADVEFGDERASLRRIAREARAKGVRIVFVMLPYYTGPTAVQDAGFYRQYGPIWGNSWLSSRADLFADYGHLTAHGAELLSDRLVAPLASELRK